MAIMRCMEALEWFGLVVGCGLVLLTLHSLLVTLVAPRHLSAAPLDSASAGTGALSARRGQISSSRLTNLVWDSVRALVERVARRARSRRYDAADRILGLAGPLSLLTLFAVWYLTLFAGFALIAWPASHGQFDEALRLSGSSLLTLGVDVPAGIAPTAVAYLGGAAGLFTVALAIAYLPT